MRQTHYKGVWFIQCTYFQKYLGLSAFSLNINYISIYGKQGENEALIIFEMDISVEG